MHSIHARMQWTLNMPDEQALLCAKASNTASPLPFAWIILTLALLKDCMDTSMSGQLLCCCTPL